MINIRGVCTPSIFSHNKHSNPLSPALAYATSLPSMSRELLLLVGHVPTVLGRSTVKTSPGALRGCEQPRASAVARCVKRGWGCKQPSPPHAATAPQRPLRPLRLSGLRAVNCPRPPAAAVACALFGCRTTFLAPRSAGRMPARHPFSGWIFYI